MDIIFDSNIYRGDFLLRSNDFDVLLDYLERTNSSIYLPQIILDEIIELYKRALKDRISIVSKAYNNLKLVLTDESIVVLHQTIDESAESDRYVDYVKRKFKLSDKNILPLKETYLTEVTRRAIQREKPCGEDGQGFRDTIIWLTLKDFCLKTKEHQITFISNNDKDFANAEKTELHETLMKECDFLGIRINYFKGIRDFIEKLSIKIDFITDDWLWDTLKIDAFNDLVIDFINANEANGLSELIHRTTKHECTGYINVTHANTYSLQSFSVYEMVDGFYIVNATFACEIEVEYEHYIYEYDNKDAHFGYVTGRHTDFTHQYFNTEIYASLKIKEKEITDFDIDGFYL
jgi:predicted nucleic acid-binding protein